MRLMEPKRPPPLDPDRLDRKPLRGGLVRELDAEAQLPRQLRVLAQLAHPREQPLVLEPPLPRRVRVRVPAVRGEVPALEDPQHELAVPQRQAAVEAAAEARVDGRPDEVVVHEVVDASGGRRAQDAVGLEEQDLEVRREVGPEERRGQEGRDGGVRVEGRVGGQVPDLDF